MNDSEIIKGLQRMSSEDPNGFSSDVLALVNRQQAEIDRLNIDLKAMRGAANSYKAHYEDLKSENLETIKCINKAIEEAKSEAVKEFVKTLKMCAESSQDYSEWVFTISESQLDKLVEEMGCNDG